MRLVAMFLLGISIFPVGFGALALSEATMGVGLIAVGCYLAIVARLFQASEHANESRELRTMIREATEKQADTVSPE